MGDISPFAGFQAASPDEGSDEGSGSGSVSPHPAPRVVGFQRSASSNTGDELPRTCSIAERQASPGGLNQLFRNAERARRLEEPLRPRLSIQTTRSLRVGPRMKLVPRIQEDAELAAGGGGRGGAEASGHLPRGSTAPSRDQPARGLARACSGNIDMPARLSKAQTAPEGLPDSLVMAAITAGQGRSQGGGGGGTHTHPVSPLAGKSSTGGALPSQLRLPSPRQQQQQQARSGSGGGGGGIGATAFGGGGSANSSRPPMPVTPATAARASQQQQLRSGGMERQGSVPQRQGSTYRDLFDAQAETSMAQAQLSGLHEALRREHDEVERLRQKLAAVIAERDMLRGAAGPPHPTSAITSVATAPPALGLAGGSGSAFGPSPGAAAAGLPGALPAGHAPPAGLSRLAPSRAGRIGLTGPAAATSAHRQLARPPPPAAEASAASAMLSAFANARPFSFD